jgi:hypothetical protein
MTDIRYGILGLLLLLAIVALPASTEALIVGACDTDHPGRCVASVSLVGSTVSISLQNTGSGYIVADAFSIGSATVRAGSFTSSDPDFRLVVVPFGFLDTLITINWLGGATPSAGIGANQSATFSFALNNGAGVTESSIFNSMLIGFAGLGLSGIDIDRVGVTRVAMPEIGSLPLLGLALGGLGILWRRRIR